MARHLGHLGGGCTVLVVCLAVTLSSGCGGHTQPYQGNDNLSINEVLEPTAEPLPLPTLTSSPTGSNAAVPEQRTWNVEHRTPSPWHNLLNSSHYSGSIAVMFKEGSGVRLRDGKWTIASPPHPDPLPLGERKISSSSSSPPWGEDQGEGALRAIEVISVPQSFSYDLDILNRAVSSYGAVIHRGMDIEEETMEAALVKANKEGKKLHDWNLYYTIEIENPDAAEKLWNVLAKNSIIAWTHPIPKMYPLGGLGPTPDLTSKQGYLDSDQATGGLNIYPAWTKGISGQGVMLADVEVNWNFGHEDVPVDRNDVVTRYDPALGGQDAVQHGTAVTGILGGKDNGLGVKGISYSSHIFAAQGPGMLLVKDNIESYVNGRSPSVVIRPGDVVVIETGVVGEATPAGNDCKVDHVNKQPSYCMPAEAYNDAFNAIEDATTLGVIVIEGAANGGTDLGDPKVQSHQCGGNPCPDLAVDDSGAIMVAASNGGKDNTKPWWSNWGKRINAYAWGHGVTTTGYGMDYDQNWQPHPNPDSDPNDPNRWYTNSFDGTSAATALVAGAVALVQSYAREYYRHTSTYDPMLADIIPHKQVYLDAWQIRELIKLAGVSCDPNYNIGYKPDVGKMFQLIEQGVVIPHVAPDNAALIPPPYAVAGVRYDMDGDKRAELISFTPSSAQGSRDGLWKMDLSTIAPNIANPNPDNYGEWDLRIEFQMDDRIDSGIFFPVVHDYDSDGDADLAIYDSKNGKWYISYITPAIIARAGNGTLRLDWDVVIDYSTDPLWKSHARPIPGDYNGDNFLDTAIVRADGHWVIDYGGIGRLVKNGGIEYRTDFRGFEKDVEFLTQQQLADAPGWGYVAVVRPSGGGTRLLFRIPDGLPDSGKLGTAYYPNFNSAMMNLPEIYGSNDDLITVLTDSGDTYLGIIRENGIWEAAPPGQWDQLNLYPPSDGYSDMLCLPVFANYGGDVGDMMEDRAVKCGSTWKIAITDPNVTDFRIVQLSDDPMSLPPTIYPGGIKYQDMKAILNFYGLFNAYRDKDPFTPYTVNCIKYWGVSPEYCLAPQ